MQPAGPQSPPSYVGRPAVSDLVELLERALLSAKHPPEVMDARQAAEFLCVSYDQFKRIARDLPRHAITERRFVYVRSELLEWVLSQPGRGREPWE